MVIILVFLALTPLQNSKGNPVSRGVKRTVMGIFFKKILCKYCPLSRKRYEIDSQLLWNTNRNTQVTDRSLSVPKTFSDLERRGVRGKISGSSPQLQSRPYPKPGGAPATQNVGDSYLCRNFLTKKDEIWCANTCGGVACFWGSATPPSQDGETSATP